MMKNSAVDWEKVEVVSNALAALAGAAAGIVGLVHVSLALVEYLNGEEEEIEAEVDLDELVGDEDEDAEDA